jgi:hypothetical protein
MHLVADFQLLLNTALVSKHETVGVGRVESANAGNLTKRLSLCIGCMVLLTRNLCADCRARQRCLGHSLQCIME